MLGWRTADVALASLKKRATISRACEYCGSSTFTAAGRPSIACSARYTTPMPPSLIRATMRWLPTTAPITQPRGSPAANPPSTYVQCPPAGTRPAGTRSTTGGGGIAPGCAPAPGGGGGGGCAPAAAAVGAVVGKHGVVTVIFTTSPTCCASGFAAVTRSAGTPASTSFLVRSAVRAASLVVTAKRI